VSLIPHLIRFLLPRETTHKWGKLHGRFLSSFLRQRFGQDTEKAFETTVYDYAKGLLEGLFEDNRKGS